LADDFEALVRRTAALARLEVSPEDAVELGHDFERILGAFRALAESGADDAGDEDGAGELEPRLRADVPVPFPDPSRLLRSAPEAEVGPAGGFLAVPKTVGEGA
jgi:aspartyl/glutamyl-tRNA(Asn/Gln) amidotransferase C subunit